MKAVIILTDSQNKFEIEMACTGNTGRLDGVFNDYFDEKLIFVV